jgi:hypothetical protein
MIEALLFLIFGHYIGDFALQNEWIATKKGEYPYILFGHAMIWSAVICAILYHFGLFHLWMAVFLIAGHFACDYWKSHQPRTPENWWLIYPDQLFHIVQILVVFMGGIL